MLARSDALIALRNERPKSATALSETIRMQLLELRRLVSEARACEWVGSCAHTGWVANGHGVEGGV